MSKKIFKGFPSMTYILKDAIFWKYYFLENYVRNTDGNYSCATRVAGVSNNSTWDNTELCQKDYWTHTAVDGGVRGGQGEGIILLQDLER